MFLKNSTYWRTFDNASPLHLNAKFYSQFVQSNSKFQMNQAHFVLLKKQSPWSTTFYLLKGLRNILDPNINYFLIKSVLLIFFIPESVYSQYSYLLTTRNKFTLIFQSMQHMNSFYNVRIYKINSLTKLEYET